MTFVISHIHRSPYGFLRLGKALRILLVWCLTYQLAWTGFYLDSMQDDKMAVYELDKVIQLSDLPIKTASDMEFINFDGQGGVPLLAYIGSEGEDTHVVKFLKGDRYEPVTCLIKTNRPLALKSFVMKNTTYLFVGQDFDIVNETQGSTLYKIGPQGCDITHVHSVRSHSPRSIEYFTIGNLPCLAVANSGIRDDNVEIESYVYEWRGSKYTGHFDIFSSFITQNARDIVHFKIYNNHYLAVANYHNNEKQVDINSEILIYNLEEHTFNHFQYIPTNAASDWEFFTFGSGIKIDFFLAVANQYTYRNGIGERNYKTKSVIYKFYRGSFIVFQELDTHGALQFTAFKTDRGEFILLLTNIWGDITIYQYNGWNFYETTAPGVDSTSKIPKLVIVKKALNDPQLSDSSSYTKLPLDSGFYPSIADESLLIVSKSKFGDLYKPENEVKGPGVNVKPTFVESNPLKEANKYMREKLHSLQQRMVKADARFSNLSQRLETLKKDLLPKGIVLNISKSEFPSFENLLGNESTHGKHSDRLNKIQEITREYIANNTLRLDSALKIWPDLFVLNLTTNRIVSLKENTPVLDDSILDKLQDLTNKLGLLNGHMSNFASKISGAVKRSGKNYIKKDWLVPRLVCLPSATPTNNLNTHTENPSYMADFGRPKKDQVKVNRMRSGFIDKNINLPWLYNKCINKTANKPQNYNFVFNGGIVSKGKLDVRKKIDGVNPSDLISGKAKKVLLLENEKIIYEARHANHDRTSYGNEYTENSRSPPNSPSEQLYIVYGEPKYPIKFYDEPVKTFTANVTIKGNLIVEDTINNVKFDTDNVLFSNKEQTIQGNFNLKNVHVKKLFLVGDLNDRNITRYREFAIPLRTTNRNAGIKIRTSKHFKNAKFQAPVLLSNPGIATINGKNLIEWKNGVLTRDTEQTIKGRVIFTGQNINFFKDVQLDKLLNGLIFPDDFVRLSELNPYKPIIMEGPVIFTRSVKFRNVITFKPIGNIDISKLLLTSRDEIIRGPVIFKNAITLKADSTINGHINRDINLTRLLAIGLRTDLPQVVKAKHLVLKGNILFKDDVTIRGLLNGISIDYFLKSTIPLNNTEFIWENDRLALEFETLVTGELTTPLLGHYDLSRDFVAKDSPEPQVIKNVGQLNFGHSQNQLLGYGHLGMVKIGEVTLNHPNNKLDNGKVNGEDWDSLFNDDTLLQGENQQIDATKIFDTPVVFNGDVQILGLFNDKNLSKAFRVESLGRVQHMLFFDSIELRTDLEANMLEVNGLLNGHYLDLVETDSLKLAGDQILTGQKVILGDSGKPVHESDYSSPGYNRHSSEKHLICPFEIQGLLSIEGFVNGQNLSHLIRESIISGLPNQVVTGNKVFKGYQIVFNDVYFEGALNGYQISDLEKVWLNDTDQFITSPVTFEELVDINADVTVNSINGRPWDDYIDEFVRIKSEDFENKQRGQSVPEHLHFNKITLLNDIKSADDDIKEYPVSSLFISEHLIHRGQAQPIVFKHRIRFLTRIVTFRQALRIERRINEILIREWLENFEITELANVFDKQTKMIGNIKIEGKLFIDTNLNEVNFENLIERLIPIKDKELHKNPNNQNTISSPIIFTNFVVFDRNVSMKEKATLNGIHIDNVMDPDRYVWKNAPCHLKGSGRFTFSKGLEINGKLRLQGFKMATETDALKPSTDKNPFIIVVDNGLINGQSIERLTTRVLYNYNDHEAGNKDNVIHVNHGLTFEEEVHIKGNLEILPRTIINDVLFKHLLQHQPQYHRLGQTNVHISPYDFNNSFHGHKPRTIVFKGAYPVVFTQVIKINREFILERPASDAVFGSVNLTELLYDTLFKGEDIVFNEDVTFHTDLEFWNNVSLMGTLNGIRVDTEHLLTSNGKQKITVPLMFDGGLCCQDGGLITLESGLVNDVNLQLISTDYLRSDLPNTIDIPWTIKAEETVKFHGDLTLGSTINGVRIESIYRNLGNLNVSLGDLRTLKDTSTYQCLALNNTYEALKNHATYVESGRLHQEILAKPLPVTKGNYTSNSIERDYLMLNGPVDKTNAFYFMGQDFILLSPLQKCQIRMCFTYHLYRRSESQRYYHPFEVFYTPRKASISVIAHGDDEVYIIASNAYHQTDIVNEALNEYCSPTKFKDIVATETNETKMAWSSSYTQIYLLKRELLGKGTKAAIGFHLHQTIQTKTPVGAFSAFISTGHEMREGEDGYERKFTKICFLSTFDDQPFSQSQHDVRAQNDDHLWGTKLDKLMPDLTRADLYCKIGENTIFTIVDTIGVKPIQKVDFAVIQNDLYMSVVYKSNPDTDINYQPPTIYHWLRFATFDHVSLPSNHSVHDFKEYPQIANPNSNLSYLAGFGAGMVDRVGLQATQHFSVIGGLDTRFIKIENEWFVIFIQSGKESNTQLAGNNLPILIYKLSDISAKNKAYQPYHYQTIRPAPKFELVQTLSVVGAKSLDFQSIVEHQTYLLFVLKQGVNRQSIDVFKFAGVSMFQKQFELTLERDVHAISAFKNMNNQTYIITSNKPPPKLHLVDGPPSREISIHTYDAGLGETEQTYTDLSDSPFDANNKNTTTSSLYGKYVQPNEFVAAEVLEIRVIGNKVETLFCPAANQGSIEGMDSIAMDQEE